MERITINAEKRVEKGTGAARALRRDEMIPAILYREGKSIPIKLPKKEMKTFFNKTLGVQVIVNLQFTDGDNKLALVKDYQIDPTKRELLHADFFEVSLTEKVKVSINIIPVGESVGIKRDGGILQHVLREIEIECLPDKIPANVEIDITELEIGQSFHVSDLKLEEGVEILTDPEEVILTIVAPVIEEVAPVEEAPAEEAEEPEVVKKGKKEEEGEETAAEPEKAQEKEEGSKG